MVSVVDCGQGAISLAGLPDATSGIGALARPLCFCPLSWHISWPGRSPFISSGTDHPENDHGKSDDNFYLKSQFFYFLINHSWTSARAAG